MNTKVALLFAFVVGTLALPAPEVEDDMSIYFDHTSGTRIVGGTVAAEGSVPYMVVLTNGLFIQSLLCGGSIVTPRHVLTAAHCIEAVFSGTLSSSLRATVGTNRWNLGGDTYAFSRNITHQNYISSTIKNDIGLLITLENIAYNFITYSVSLSYEHVGGGIESRAAGWGRIAAGGAISTELLELTVTTLDGQQCVEEVARRARELNIFAPAVDPAVEVCTYHSLNHGMCNGDSGSALVRIDTGEQIALVSWGLPCALDAPDMFVRVSAYAEWIDAGLRQL